MQHQRDFDRYSIPWEALEGNTRIPKPAQKNGHEDDSEWVVTSERGDHDAGEAKAKLKAIRIEGLRSPCDLSSAGQATEGTRDQQRHNDGASYRYPGIASGFLRGANHVHVESD